MQDRIELPEEIINKIFTANLRDENGKKLFTPLVKQKYAEYLLEKNWLDILGEHLAKYCCIHKIDGNDLVIYTANSILANELFMMKDLLLNKINGCLNGKIEIKKISFQVNSKIKSHNTFKETNEAENNKEDKKVYSKPCPKCGVIIQSDDEMCDVCTREEKNILKFKIAELLNVQPWLSYEKCLAYYKCDKLLFKAVKDNLQNTYFERVRLNTADENDCLMAVMFLTGKAPEEINENIYDNTLNYLRRYQNVSSSRIRLYGKK